MKIKHISVSRKQLWDQCEQAYKYKYHLEVQSPEPEPEYFLYGKLVHKIAEEYVKNKGKVEIESFLHPYLKGELLLENKKVELTKDYKNKLKEHLTNIKKLNDRIGFEGETEYSFRYDLDPPQEKFATGVIDRILIKDEKCYARVIQRYFNIKPENIRAALYYLDGGDIVATKFNEPMLMTAESILLDTYNDIVNKDAEVVRGSVGNHCNRCDFRKMCTWYRSR